MDVARICSTFSQDWKYLTNPVCLSSQSQRSHDRLDFIQFDLRRMLYRENFWIRLVPCDLPFQRGSPSHRVTTFNPLTFGPLLTFSPLPTFRPLLTGGSPPIWAAGGVGAPLPHHAHSALTNHWKRQKRAKATSRQATTVLGTQRSVWLFFLVQNIHRILWNIWKKEISPTALCVGGAALKPYPFMICKCIMKLNWKGGWKIWKRIFSETFSLSFFGIVSHLWPVCLSCVFA